MRDRAQYEIKLIDDERRALRRLLAFANRYLDKGSGRSKVRRRPPKTMPLTIIREHPGIRSSMVAQLLRREAPEVASEIEELESTGQIRRDGLGWVSTV
jgi:hypothetical protein